MTDRLTDRRTGGRTDCLTDTYKQFAIINVRRLDAAIDGRICLSVKCVVGWWIVGLMGSRAGRAGHAGRQEGELSVKPSIRRDVYVCV